jgi:integrase
MVEPLSRSSEPGVDGLVFVMPEGTPLRRENFCKRVWLPACGASGVEGVRFHDLRHTNATLAAASGAPLRAVMHRLGHASAAAALRYQHRMAGQDEAIAEFLHRVARQADDVSASVSSTG